jgi:prevent-host-death family protein
MKTVSVATLKQKLSEYLRLVEQGDEVVVTSHRRPVARLTAEDGRDLTIRPPTQALSALRRVRGVRVPNPFSAVQTLLHDRERR